MKNKERERLKEKKYIVFLFAYKNIFFNVLFTWWGYFYSGA